MNYKITITLHTEDSNDDDELMLVWDEVVFEAIGSKNRCFATMYNYADGNPYGSNCRVYERARKPYFNFSISGLNERYQSLLVTIEPTNIKLL